MQKISNVNLSVAIGDYTGSNIENWVNGEEHLLKLNLKDVKMLPKFLENKNADTYNLHIIKGCENDKGAKAAFNYVLAHPNRFTDDTMFTFALMHVLVLYRKKYGLDKEFDPENFKKYMDELLIDYTEMLLQYYKAYETMAILGPMMRKLWDNCLKGIPKNKLKERISVLKSNPDIVSKEDNEKKFYCKSWANGAAMHVSPVAFAARCIEELDFMIEQTTKNTHDHPESIKGAKCVGQFIFLGRINWSKESIKRWIQYKFSTNEYLPDEYIPGRKIEAIQGKYDMNVTLEEIRQKYKRDLRCKYTVTPALIAVLEANSFKEAVDNARSIGGDCDTICAIAAQMAATLWPINPEYITTVKGYLLDFQTSKKQIELEDVNGKKEVIQCRDKKEKNILFQNINDEYEKNFGGYYRDSAPIEWQLKNTLSIVKDLHNDIKNIATDEKRQYLIDLINSIKDDLKQFQNIEDMSTKNLLVEIEKEINKLGTEVQNLDVKDNYSEGRIKTPEGFYELTKVVSAKYAQKKNNEMENQNLEIDQKNPKQVTEVNLNLSNSDVSKKDVDGNNSIKDNFVEGTISQKGSAINNLKDNKHIKEVNKSPDSNKNNFLDNPSIEGDPKKDDVEKNNFVMNDKSLSSSQRQDITRQPNQEFKLELTLSNNNTIILSPSSCQTAIAELRKYPDFCFQICLIKETIEQKKCSEASDCWKELHNKFTWQEAIKVTLYSWFMFRIVKWWRGNMNIKIKSSMPTRQDASFLKDNQDNKKVPDSKDKEKTFNNMDQTLNK